MKSRRWMHRRDWDTTKWNCSIVSLREFHNAMAIPTHGRSTQKRGTCCGDILGKLHMNRRWRIQEVEGRPEQRIREETEQTADKQILIIIAKGRLLVKDGKCLKKIIFCYL